MLLPQQPSYRVHTQSGRTFCATSGGTRRVRRVGVTEAALEGGMNPTLRQQLLEHALTIIRHARLLVESIERRDRDLGNQLRRSLNGTALNVAEAFGVHGGNSRLSFRRALGELYESQATLQVATAWGFITEKQGEVVAAELNALGARLYGLSRR
jgi:four helix bundle protein